MLRAAVRAVDPALGMVDDGTMAGRIADSPSAYLQRSSAWLIGAFAAIALLLGVVGLYGVVAHAVGQRSREIGVRVALGADRRAVQVLVFKDAWRMVALGTGSGLLAALAAATFFRDRLFATSAFDVPTFVSVAAALAAAATVASYLPARRAAAVDPNSVLRGD